MKKTLYALCAASAIALATPANAALTMVGSGGTGFQNPPGTGTCTQTSPAYLSCVGYAGNLLNNSSIADLNTALDALIGGSGYTPDAVWSSLDPTKALISGTGSSDIITFTNTLSGLTILGIKFGGADNPQDVNNYTNFYLVNFGSGTTTFDLNRQGFSSGVEINAPMPEPGTWAMMLLGFGAIGLSIRRRRNSQVLAQIA